MCRRSVQAGNTALQAALHSGKGLARLHPPHWGQLSRNSQHRHSRLPPRAPEGGWGSRDKVRPPAQWCPLHSKAEVGPDGNGHHFWAAAALGRLGRIVVSYAIRLEVGVWWSREDLGTGRALPCARIAPGPNSSRSGGADDQSSLRAEKFYREAGLRMPKRRYVQATLFWILNRMVRQEPM